MPEVFCRGRVDGTGDMAILCILSLRLTVGTAAHYKKSFVFSVFL